MNMQNASDGVSETWDFTSLHAPAAYNHSETMIDIFHHCDVPTRFYIDAVVAGPLCLLGLFGNVLSFICLGMDKELAPAAALTLRALACSDIALLTGWLVAYTLRAILEFVHGIALWSSITAAYILLYFHKSLFITQMTTAWLTVLVAVWRYMSFTKIVAVRRSTSVVIVRASIVLVFFASIAFSLPRYFSQNITGNTTVFYHLDFTEFGRSTGYRIVYAQHLYSVFTFLLPFTVLTAFSALLLHAYRARSRRRAELMPRHASSISSSEASTTRVVVTIVVVFAVCNLPAKIMGAFSRQTDICPAPMYYFTRVSYLLETLNSTANFVIYFLLRRQFRDAVKRALSSKRRRKRLAATAAEANVRHMETVID